MLQTLSNFAELLTMTRQTLTVNQYEQMQKQFNFQDQQYGSVNCYHSPLYYNNPLYFDPLSYEVIDND